MDATQTKNLARRIARKVLAAKPSNPLDGLRRPQAVRQMAFYITQARLQGIFRDDHWAPIQRLWDTLTDVGVEWVVDTAEYDTDARGNPAEKTWRFTVDYLNEHGKPAHLYGRCVASGAGSVDEPLSAYDVVAYAN